MDCWTVGHYLYTKCMYTRTNQKRQPLLLSHLSPQLSLSPPLLLYLTPTLTTTLPHTHSRALSPTPSPTHSHSHPLSHTGLMKRSPLCDEDTQHTPSERSSINTPAVTSFDLVLMDSRYVLYCTCIWMDVCDVYLIGNYCK